MAGHVQLLMGATFEDAWSEVARPWFARAASAAMMSESPWVVLTPSRALGHALKARLVADGINLGAVYFWTPGELRAQLARRLATAVTSATREHLHLLLAVTAQRDGQPVSRTVAREPARLMRTLDQLAAAGLDAAALDYAPAEKLAVALQRALRDAGWTTVQQLDWMLAAKPPESALGALLMMGFDGAHWELWPLLRAAAGSTRDATVLLTRPRSKAEQLDQAWIGTWEHAFGAVDDIAEETTPGPFAPLAHRMENPEGSDAGTRSTGVEFLIGRNVREQADAIVAQGLHYLAGGAVSRIGVLFPGPCPLAREVSARLLDRGIPHFDAFGHPAPPPPVALKWRAWTTLQRSHRLEALLRLLTADPARAAPGSLGRLIDRAYGDVLVDDLAVLSARLKDMGQPEALDAENFLARFPRLPSEGSVGELIEAVRSAWRGLGWNDLIAELDPHALSLAALTDLRLALGAFLDWLDSVAPRPAPIRDGDASNPLALVHLLPYAQAEGLPWSHLIFADLNEGRWPPPFETAGYLSDDRIAELNRQTLVQGDQGEGHVTAQPGRSVILGPYERRELCRRQFYNLVEAATHGLAAVCALEGETDSGRVIPASAFLSHLHFTDTGEALTEPRMQALQQRTAEWLARLPASHAVAPPVQPTPVSRVAVAYQARREPKPFGPFECAFSVAAPPRPIELTCKAWEQAVRDPAGAWLAAFAGVAPGEAVTDGDRWPLTCGTWVHSWLATSVCGTRGRIEPRRSGDAIVRGVQHAVLQTRRTIAHAFARAGRAEPQWWAARVTQAEWIALQFAGHLAALDAWPFAAVEWPLPQPAHATSADGVLRLRGRVDLLLAPESAKSIPTTCWVADFKTGGEKPLTQRTLKKQLTRGRAIQLCLYALALADSGARDVSVSLLTPDAAVAPQVDLAAILAEDRFWSGLVRMQETGIFGMRGEVRAEYGASRDVPLAALPVEADLLEEKWALTHPGLVSEEDDDA